MMVLGEEREDLQLTLPDGIVGRKFDGDTHGLSHCISSPINFR